MRDGVGVLETGQGEGRVGMLRETGQGEGWGVDVGRGQDEGWGVDVGKRSG